MRRTCLDRLRCLPARQSGRRRAPRPLSLSVHHSKITTKDPPLRERPHLPGIGPTVPATTRKELVTRLQAGRCEWCQRHADVEVHQVRKLADLTRPGRSQPAWARLMAQMRRKTLIVGIESKSMDAPNARHEEGRHGLPDDALLAGWY